MGVEHFGDQNELELGVIINWVSSHLDHEVLSVLLNGSLHERVKGGVNFLLDSFQHDSLTIGDGGVQGVKPVLLIGVQAHQVLFQTTSQPDLSLQLGIDDQGPTSRTGDDGGVLNGHGISGKVFVLPLGLLGFSGQHFKRSDVVSDGDLEFDDVGQPLLGPEVHSELKGEGSDVGDEGGGQKTISNNGLSLVHELLHQDLPTGVFAR